MKTVYLYILDTMADWEPGYAVAELNSGRYFKVKGERLPVVTLGATSQPVTTMGGIEITPQKVLDHVNLDDTALLILPGADTWQQPDHRAVLDLSNRMLSKDIPVAAICGATIALAQAGLLDARKHTSNDLKFLKQVCPNYAGAKLYMNEPAVTDGSLITASGLAPLNFAKAIFEKLEVMSAETLTAWHDLYKTREAAKFYALIESLPK